ncbi:MAG: phytoene synthase [Hyphococcus sp.]|nr:MAG: phytoene synthase [Marinicaulis sp.]
MDESETHAAEFCSDLVRAHDEDRWLSANYASEENSRKLLALYALQCELRHIPAAVSEPPLGEIRLQWWREALTEIRDGKSPRAHPVVEEAADCGLANEEYKDLLDAAIDAAARPLYGEGFSDVADLTAWLNKADGSFDAIAVHLLGGDVRLANAAADAGAAFALAREGRKLAPNLTNEIDANISELWERQKVQLKKTPLEIWPAFLPFALTPAYLKNPQTPFPLRKRLKLFSAFAFGML